LLNFSVLLVGVFLAPRTYKIVEISRLCDCVDGFKGKNCEFFVGGNMELGIAESQYSQPPKSLLKRILFGLSCIISSVAVLFGLLLVKRCADEKRNRVQYNAEASVATAELVLNFEENDEDEGNGSKQLENKMSPQKSPKDRGDNYSLVDRFA